MSAMTHTAISECSFFDSEVDTLDDSIERTCSKLRTALEDVVLLRKQLRELVAMKKESAIQQVNKAKQHLKFIEKQESELSNLLGEDGTSSSVISHHEADDGSGSPLKQHLKLKKELSNLLGVDGPQSSSFISHHGEGDGSGSPLKVGKDLVNQDHKSQNYHPDIDLYMHQVSLEDQYPDLDSMNTGGDVVSKDGTEDNVLAHKTGEGEGSNPFHLLNDSANLERLDSATINDKLCSYRMQIDILEEERRRREEALALAVVSKADEELLTLQAERGVIQERCGMITNHEEELILQREEGLRVASLWAPGSKTTGPNKKKWKKGLGC